MIAITAVNVVIFSVQSLVSRNILSGDRELEANKDLQNIYYNLVTECVKYFGTQPDRPTADFWTGSNVSCMAYFLPVLY